MSFMGGSKSWHAAIKAFSVSATRTRNIVRLLVIVLGAASLAACADSTAVRNSNVVSPSRQASLPHDRTAPLVPDQRVTSVRKHTPFARHHHAAPTQVASQGIASFYTEDQQTASGEKFNTHDMTAAHRTLPFGTRLRVTNVATGRSVTVRVNDRGPYIPGRVVDVSGSAANELGITESGIAKVKVDVVH
jgi:rare lipoprotein A